MRRIDTRKFLFYRVVAPTRGEYQNARGPGQCQVLSGWFERLVRTFAAYLGAYHAPTASRASWRLSGIVGAVVRRFGLGPNTPPRYQWVEVQAAALCMLTFANRWLHQNGRFRWKPEWKLLRQSYVFRRFEY